MSKYKWAVLFLVLMASVAVAQTKTTGTLQCSKADPQYAIPVGDHPGHVMEVEQTKCTWTKPMEIATIASKDGVSTATGEINGDKAHTSGSHVTNMANGDQVFTTFQGSSTLKDGKPSTSEGTWAFTDGTGKLKGIHGKGTYKGAPGEGGVMVFQIEGEYTLPKSK